MNEMVRTEYRHPLRQVMLHLKMLEQIAQPALSDYNFHHRHHRYHLLAYHQAFALFLQRSQWNIFLGR
jgi:hypothetical protein